MFDSAYIQSKNKQLSAPYLLNPFFLCRLNSDELTDGLYGNSKTSECGMILRCIVRQMPFCYDKQNEMYLSLKYESLNDIQMRIKKSMKKCCITLVN